MGFGIENKIEKWRCPVVGFVALTCTLDQLMALSAHKDVVHLSEIEETYPPMIVSVRTLNEVGICPGGWEFGFLGDVTPKDDKKLLILPTDSTHILWMHWSVE